MNKLTRQLQMQGEKHIIWDMIIVEDVKLRPYLNYILDKEMGIHVSKQSGTAVKESLNKNHVDTVKNTINLLNALSDDLRTMGFKDRITMITSGSKTESQ